MMNIVYETSTVDAVSQTPFDKYSWWFYDTSGRYLNVDTEDNNIQRPSPPLIHDVEDGVATAAVLSHHSRYNITSPSSSSTFPSDMGTDLTFSYSPSPPPILSSVNTICHPPADKSITTKLLTNNNNNNDRSADTVVEITKSPDNNLILKNNKLNYNTNNNKNTGNDQGFLLNEHNRQLSTTFSSRGGSSSSISKKNGLSYLFSNHNNTTSTEFERVGVGEEVGHDEFDPCKLLHGQQSLKKFFVSRCRDGNYTYFLRRRPSLRQLFVQKDGCQQNFDNENLLNKQQPQKRLDHSYPIDRDESYGKNETPANNYKFSKNKKFNRHKSSHLITQTKQSDKIDDDDTLLLGDTTGKRCDDDDDHFVNAYKYGEVDEGVLVDVPPTCTATAKINTRWRGSNHLTTHDENYNNGHRNYNDPHELITDNKIIETTTNNNQRNRNNLKGDLVRPSYTKHLSDHQHLINYNNNSKNDNDDISNTVFVNLLSNIKFSDNHVSNRYFSNNKRNLVLLPPLNFDSSQRNNNNNITYNNPYPVNNPRFDSKQLSNLSSTQTQHHGSGLNTASAAIPFTTNNSESEFSTPRHSNQGRDLNVSSTTPHHQQLLRPTDDPHPSRYRNLRFLSTTTKYPPPQETSYLSNSQRRVPTNSTVDSFPRLSKLLVFLLIMALAFLVSTIIMAILYAQTAAAKSKLPSVVVPKDNDRLPVSIIPAHLSRRINASKAATNESFEYEKNKYNVPLDTGIMADQFEEPDYKKEKVIHQIDQLKTTDGVDTPGKPRKEGIGVYKVISAGDTIKPTRARFEGAEEKCKLYTLGTKWHDGIKISKAGQNLTAHEKFELEFSNIKLDDNVIPFHYRIQFLPLLNYDASKDIFQNGEQNKDEEEGINLFKYPNYDFERDNKLVQNVFHGLHKLHLQKKTSSSNNKNDNNVKQSKSVDNNRTQRSDDLKDDTLVMAAAAKLDISKKIATTNTSKLANETTTSKKFLRVMDTQKVFAFFGSSRIYFRVLDNATTLIKLHARKNLFIEPENLITLHEVHELLLPSVQQASSSHVNDINTILSSQPLKMGAFVPAETSLIDEPSNMVAAEQSLIQFHVDGINFGTTPHKAIKTRDDDVNLLLHRQPRTAALLVKNTAAGIKDVVINVEEDPYELDIHHPPDVYGEDPEISNSKDSLLGEMQNRKSIKNVELDKSRDGAAAASKLIMTRIPNEQVDIRDEKSKFMDLNLAIHNLEDSEEDIVGVRNLRDLLKEDDETEKSESEERDEEEVDDDNDDETDEDERDNQKLIHGHLSGKHDDKSDVDGNTDTNAEFDESMYGPIIERSTTTESHTHSTVTATAFDQVKSHKIKDKGKRQLSKFRSPKFPENKDYNEAEDAEKLVAKFEEKFVRRLKHLNKKWPQPYPDSTRRRKQSSLNLDEHVFSSLNSKDPDSFNNILIGNSTLGENTRDKLLGDSIDGNETNKNKKVKKEEIRKLWLGVTGTNVIPRLDSSKSTKVDEVQEIDRMQEGLNENNKSVPTAKTTIDLEDNSGTHEIINDSKFELGENIQITLVERVEKYDWLKLTTAKPLEPGKMYVIDIPFRSEIKKDLAGLYLSSYLYKSNEHHLAVTQFEPTDARKAFPCFDEPRMKATFDISIVTSRRSISNAPQIGAITTGVPGYNRHVFATSPFMSTYLLAFSENDFEVVTGKNPSQSGVKFAIWVRKEFVPHAEYAVEIAPKVLDFFEEYFGIKYPLPKMDMMAVPDFSAGAMENWGLITYRESALLFDPKVTSLANKERIASIIVHELSHQWFGNLVTMKWWDDLWLNEGFASYMEYQGTEAIHPEWDIKSIFPLTDLQQTFASDALTHSHPIHVPVANPTEIGQIFDVISYSKGSAVIRMMNHILGESSFRHGLKDYLSTLQYKNADHNDLWYHLQKASNIDGLNLKEIMDTWILQMGYPCVYVTRNYEKASTDPSMWNIKLEQFYFLANRTAEWSTKYPSPYNYTWYIPFTFIVKTSPLTVSKEQHIWLNRTSAVLNLNAHKLTQEYPLSDHQVSITQNYTVDSPDKGDKRNQKRDATRDFDAELPESSVFKSTDWILGNVNQTGVYRVMYDRHNWELLVAQLMTNHKMINPINRAQILDDLFNFAKASYISYDLPMRATKYLIYESEYLPWSTVYRNGLEYIGEMLKRRPTYGIYKDYMQMLIFPQYHKIGWRFYPDTQLKSTLMQEDIIRISCQHEILDCILESKKRYRDLMTNPSTNEIQPHLRSIVYCNVISQGSTDEWEFAFEKYKTEEVAQEKLRYLIALGCSREPWILTRILHYTFNESLIRPQDMPTLLRSVALANQVGRIISWDFIANNWKKIIDKWGNNYYALETVISVFMYGRNSKEELDDVLYFMKKQKDNKLLKGEALWQQGIERINLNIAYLDRNEKIVTDWLQTLIPYFKTYRLSQIYN